MNNYALVIGFWRWKEQWFHQFIPGLTPIYLGEERQLAEVEQAMRAYQPAAVYVWAFSEPAGLAEMARSQGVALFRVEDGFLRSRGLTGHRQPALSLCMDSQGLYFDPSGPSDLETLLVSGEFAAEPALMQRAADLRARLNLTGVSKYNHLSRGSSNLDLRGAGQERVLVIGQVEDDESIRRGFGPGFSNRWLVETALDEFPRARILFKPHPDVQFGHRPARSDLSGLNEHVEVLTQPVPLADVLAQVDLVYTATSLVGMEALIRGLPVKVLGQPFYAGWGLTDDARPLTRRNRQLSVEALLAGAYILYPRYINPATGRRMDALAAVDRLCAPQAA